MNPIAKDSFLDSELAQHPADLLYEADLRGGGKGYVHVLFEHEPAICSGRPTRAGLAGVHTGMRLLSGGGQPLPG